MHYAIFKPGSYYSFCDKIKLAQNVAVLCDAFKFSLEGFFMGGFD